MTSFGLICAGTSSENFTLTLCQTCHEHHAQDKLLFVGVHPSGDNAKTVVTTLKSLGIKAATVERQDVTETADIYALSALFQAFNDITVPVPDLVVLVLDEQFLLDPNLITQSWQAIRTFKETYPRVEVIAVYFTQKNRYTSALDQIKALVLGGGNHTSRAPLGHALLISDRATLRTKFGTQYRQILARHLAILLISETPSTLRKQIHGIKTPFVGLALDEVATPRIWERAITRPGQLPQHAVEEVSGALVNAVIALLNMPDAQASFDTIGPEARTHGEDMLAVTIFTPPLREKDRTALDSAVEKKLDTYCVDARGVVVPQPQQPGETMRRLTMISCFSIPLVKANALREHVPMINRLPLLQKRDETCQLLVLFGLDDPH